VGGLERCGDLRGLAVLRGCCSGPFPAPPARDLGGLRVWLGGYGMFGVIGGSVELAMLLWWAGLWYGLVGFGRVSGTVVWGWVGKICVCSPVWCGGVVGAATVGKVALGGRVGSVASYR